MRTSMGPVENEVMISSLSHNTVLREDEAPTRRGVGGCGGGCDDE